jgi:uncharacterized membrane protein
VDSSTKAPGSEVIGLIRKWEGFAQMRVLTAALFVVWFILKFFLHKGGYVHMFLIVSLSIFVVKLLAYRKTQYHKTSSER